MHQSEVKAMRIISTATDRSGSRHSASNRVASLSYPDRTATPHTPRLISDHRILMKPHVRGEVKADPDREDELKDILSEVLVNLFSEIKNFRLLFSEIRWYKAKRAGQRG